MKTIFCILPLLVFSNCCLNAQDAPGYLGKRFTVAYYASMFPNFKYESYNKDFDEQHLFALNLRNNFEAEYVLTRNMSVGADYRFLKTGTMIDIWNYSESDPDYYPSLDGYLNIKSSMAGVHVTFYKWQRGFIAPLGGYSKLGLNYMVSNGVAGTTDVSPSSSKYVRYAYEPVKSIVFTAGFGYQNIIFNYMTFNFGVDIGINSKGWGPLIQNGFEPGNINDQYDTEEGIQDGIDAMNARLASMLLLNINVGLGFIVF